jgi:osmotically-inducible protein OsmY
VAPSAEIGDGAVRARLRDSFAQDPDFSDLDIREDAAVGAAATRFEPVAGAGGEARGRIDIEVEAGVVTLNGYVPTLVRKRLAGAMAWWMPGVRDVVNGLVVRPAEEDGPDRIEEAVRVVLDRDPSVVAAQIKVGARNTVVRLTGLVRTAAEREAAERDAWAVFGVDDVINEIEVRR